MTSLQVPDGELVTSMVACCSNKNQLVLGVLEKHRRLQSRRIGFRKQLNKILPLKDNSSNLNDSELIVASLEEPHLAFLDPDKEQAVNLIALISKSTFKTIHIQHLHKNEVLMSLTQIDKNTTGIDSAQSSQYILAGTSFLNPDETIPTKGRLLIFKVEHKLCQL